MRLQRLTFAGILLTAWVAESQSGVAPIAIAPADGLHEPNLQLVGTLLFMGGKEQRNSALISVDGGPAILVTTDQWVTPEIALVNVETKRVSLRRKEQVFNLGFSDSSKRDTPPAAHGPPPIPAMAAHANALAEPHPGITPLSDTQFRVSRTLINNYLHSLEALADSRGEFVDDSGLLITGIREGTLLEHIGLHVGDVITTVDGNSLKDQASLQKLLGRLNAPSGEPGSIDVELIRSGGVQRLTYELRN